MPKRDDKPVTEKNLTLALQELDRRLDKKVEEILDHFDVVAENIHRDVAGANRNEISLVHNKIDQHEERITALEQKV